MMLRGVVVLLLWACIWVCKVHALGQELTIAFHSYLGDELLLSGSDDSPAELLLDSEEYWSVLRVAGDLVKDFETVTGRKSLTLTIDGQTDQTGRYEYFIPDNYYEYSTNGPYYFEGPEFNATGPSPKTAIIAGTIGKSRLIDDMIRQGKIDVSNTEGKWEAFKSEVVSNPCPGIDHALVVAGSDKRGTIYGLYDISEQIGISPLYFWGDVTPKHHLDIYAVNKAKEQGSPSIQYRGLFINDEAPGLANWAEENFGRVEFGVALNSEFYSKVFELILRLRGNYLWPAMWASMFYIDDALNQPLADAYGVVMGTSHTEPLLRTKEEWIHYGDGIWQWDLNNETIRPFFEYGVSRAKPYEGIYNLGMRGFDDSEMLVSPDEAVKMLQNIVSEQREMLTDILQPNNISDIPQMWCLYKEVQGYYEKGMTVPDDVILLWSDDNYGNVRRVPVKNETNRTGGAGLYYHL